MYLMITVISNIDKIKPIMKGLKHIGIKNNVILDALGTNSMETTDLTYQPAIESVLSSISQVSQYRKVILSIILEEELFFKATQEVEKALGNDLKKPNSGIMFTIPFSPIGIKEYSSYTNL